MKVNQANSLLSKIEQRIHQSTDSVVLSRELKDLANYSQISRALRKLVQQQKLIKISQGVFVKPKFYSERLKQPVISFKEAYEEALQKLNIKWELNQAWKAYNAGSTQVPVKCIIKLKSRCTRRFAYDNLVLKYE